MWADILVALYHNQFLTKRAMIWLEEWGSIVAQRRQHNKAHKTETLLFRSMREVKTDGKSREQGAQSG